ncbi:hypothetical protein EJB05_55143, partial [Eragrostis curvula]
MYPPCLLDWDAAGQYSWGSAVLAFLYRQLCEACRRCKPRSSLGGCVFLLQLWMWSRLPVGRPKIRAQQPWTPEGVLEQLPTAAYVWGHVNWWPYGDECVAALENGIGLNPLCRRYSELWTMRFDHLKQKKAWTEVDYADMESFDDENTPYDVATREGTVVELGPVLHRVGRDIRRSVNEMSNAMTFPVGQPDGESRLRAAMERLQRRLRRVAARCGCRAQTMQDVAPPVVSPERSRASGGSRSCASGGSRSRGRASSSRGASSSRTRSRARGSSSSDASDGNDHDYEAPEQDEIGPSQLGDAPSSSQATQRTRRLVDRYTPRTYALGNKGKGKRGR